jgi:DNA-binding NtrC family response regulator
MSERARLLYVEDDTGLARLLSKGLAAHDIDLTHVETCAQALAAIQREPFHVIALDHNLAGETGLDLLEALKDQQTAPPVIYVTGSDDARVAVAALKAGAVDYVWKDTAGHYRELLAQAVGAALDQQRLKDEKLQAEHALREAKDRLEILLAEVNHRIANSLTLISSLTRLQANAIDDPACKAALTETQARVLAIAGVHKHLYSNALCGGSSSVRISAHWCLSSPHR